jgi:hypothetical protein
MIGSRYFSNLAVYSPNTNFDGNTVTEAIIKYNIDNPPTSVYESSWFIPSHDEMALISYLTKITTDFNINASLAINGHSPIFGNYWTSTGTFDLTNSEGYSDSLTHGSLAWKVNIPDSTVPGASTASTRTDTGKIRPIKIIRCDGRYPTPSDDNYKLWRLPLINI